MTSKFSRVVCYVIGAAATGPRISRIYCLKFRESNPQPAPANVVWRGQKDHYFLDEAMKRFLVLDGDGLVLDAPAILAPGKGLPEPKRKANHKLALRKAPGTYNYRGIINTFVPFNGATVDGARHRRRLH